MTAQYMKALRFHDRNVIKVEDTEPLTCGTDEVRLKVAYCGICGSDIHEVVGGPILIPKKGTTYPNTGASIPKTLGHEFSGTIIEVGSGVTHLKAGQEVTVNPALHHASYGLEPCDACREGRVNICGATSTYGMTAQGGGFSENTVVKAASCFPLPNGVSLKVGALVEPLAVAHHCVTLSGFKKDQTALVCGAGPIELAMMLILQVFGAENIIITEVEPSRIEQAKKFGADVVLNPLDKDANVLQDIHQLTSSGVDIAFDCSGLQATLDLCIECTRPGGIIFNVAIHEHPLSIQLNALSLKEKTLMGAICYVDDDFRAILKLLQDGKISMAEDMITAVIPLSNAVDGGFMELINNKAAHVKILVRPD